MPRNISRNIPAASFPCTSRDGRRKRKRSMPVGQDTLDWKKIFSAAKTGGIKNYFVEMNLENDEGQRSLSSQTGGLKRNPQRGIVMNLGRRRPASNI